MSVLQDFSQILAELGFVFDQHSLEYKHASGTHVIFIPIESENTIIAENTHPIVIHEDIWLNKKTAVINRLTALTGNTTRIHGRQCTVKRIDSTLATAFLNQFHTGGFVNSYFRYGLFFREELIAVGLFGKARNFHTENNHSYRSSELTRYACKTGIRITGGLDKLMTAFCNENDVTHLMTYADKEWTDGKSYFTLGFKKVADTPPLQFKVHRKTGIRLPVNKEPYDEKEWKLKYNLGNMKLIRIKNPRC